MFYHRYTLTAQGPLNAKSKEVSRQGVLIRADNGGVGCLHPWPELGDATLQEELDALRNGTPLTLGTRAVECAKLDAQARHQGVHLLAGLKIPRSHATLPSSVSPATVRTMDGKGFTAGKIKASSPHVAAFERITILATMVPTWRWRLDFNGSLTLQETLEFWASLPTQLKCLIDFIEDPCPCSITEPDWIQLQEVGIPLALDTYTKTGQDVLRARASVRPIIKPARESSPDKLSAHALNPIFTSMMDHPVGQMWAAYNAALFYKDTPAEDIPLCGLCTQWVFEPNAFSECLGPMSPQLLVPDGTGLGFDELLDSIPWQKL